MSGCQTGTFPWTFLHRLCPHNSPSCHSAPGSCILSGAESGVEDKATPGQGREASRVSQRQASGEWLCGQPSWHPPTTAPTGHSGPGVGGTVLEPALSRQLLSHSLRLSLLASHSQRRTLRVREDPSHEGAKQGFEASPPFSGARFLTIREGIQAGPAGQAGAQRAVGLGRGVSLLSSPAQNK